MKSTPLEFAKNPTICPHCEGKRYYKLTSHDTGGKCFKCGVFDPPFSSQIDADAKIKKSARGNNPNALANLEKFTKYVPPKPNEQTTAKPKEDLGTIIEKREHIYYNEDGTDYLTKVDITKYSSGKKTAYQSRWDTITQTWISGKGALNGVTTTLYDAPYLKQLQAALQAQKDSTTVYIVEGEFDCETLKKHSLLATTNPMGAGKWNQPQYNELLRGLNVVILPDNDTKGREHGEQVFQALQGIAASIKTVNLWELMPDLMEKGDVSDYLKAGGTIAAIIEKAEKTTEKPGPDVKDAPLIISNYTAVRDQVSATKWAWMQWIPKGYLTMIAAQPGKGKSYVLLWIAKIFIHGGLLPDGTIYTPEQGGKILWCDTEGAQGMTLERAASIGLPLEDILAPLENPFDPVNLGDTEHRKRFEILCNRDEIQIIVIDSLSGAHSRKENDSGEMKEILIWLQGVAQRTNKPIICTHHFNKLNFLDALPNIDKVRGSSAIIQFFRSVISIDCPDVLTPERKRLAVIKSNLCMTPEMLGFEITDGGREIIFMDAPDAPRKETMIGKSIVWLAEFLKEEKLQTDVENAAKKADFSDATIRRAKKALGVTSRKKYDHFTKKDKWYWSLEKQGAHQGAQENAPRKSEHLEHLEHLENAVAETTHTQGDTFIDHLDDVSPKYRDHLERGEQIL